MKDSIYKGMLNYSDGRKKLISIPGSKNKKGHIFVPKSIELEGILFVLNEEGHTDEWFSYIESEKKEPKPLGKMVPYKNNIH